MPRNFLIVGTQRIGSKALWNALNFHPDVVCGGEWTLHIPSHNKIRTTERALTGDFLDLLARYPNTQKRLGDAFSADTEWLGFKILFRSSDKWLVHPRFSPALWLDRLEGHLKWLRKRPDIRIIHLIRCDTVEWLKSKYLADLTRTYTDTPYPDGLKVAIPIWSAIRRVRSKNWVDGRLASLAESNPYLRIYYEDLLADSANIPIPSLQFLQCDISKVMQDGPSRKRQSRGTAADYLSNYDELVRELERHRLLASKFCNAESSTDDRDSPGNELQGRATRPA